MEARAYLNYARISPRKVSIVLDLIRNKPADEAMAILKHTPKDVYKRQLLFRLDFSAVGGGTTGGPRGASGVSAGYLRPE